MRNSNTNIKKVESIINRYFLISTNWFQQVKNKIESIDKLNQLIELTLEEQRGLLHSRFNFAITPYLLNIIDSESSECPIRKQFIPTVDEVKTTPEDLSYIISQKKDTLTPYNDKVPFGIIHKYRDRVILLLTDQCASYCRFCSKKDFVGKNNWVMTNGEFGLVLNYLKEHKEVKQIILSGGDPLILSDEKLNFFLSKIKKLEHISIVRIETRIPVVLPQRITQKLCEILSKYSPIYINITFNHPKEITNLTEHVCNMLANYGIVLFSNTVLLKNINDRVNTLTELFYRLLKIKVVPKYLFQCDVVEGTSHFRVPISVGLKILKQIKNDISNIAVPEYVVNVNNYCKITIGPQCFISKTKNSVIIKNLDEKVFVYPDNK
ncbi:MAG: KamA family radical SAM protein [Endomicrobia bacterium]|nr:KamA family radical SAM protein [Endomicrobiia bacterium]